MTKPASRNRAELVSLGISLTLLIGVIAAVSSLWLSPSVNPPQFTIQRGVIRSDDGNAYYLPLTLTNDGDATAAQVMVEGSLDTGDSEELSSTTFDFVPARSAVEGVLIFSQEPTDVRLRVVSYQRP